MGLISFLLPNNAPPAATADLALACIAGGYDNMPAPTRVVLNSGRLDLQRDADESGSLVCPWTINGAGQLMGSSATLIQRPTPYRLSVELARGKINQLRSQASDWRMVGLQIPDSVDALIREAISQFGRAATESEGAIADQDALAALATGYKAANQLVRVYVDQMLRARHQRTPQLDTGLGVRLNGLPPPAAAEDVLSACNSISVPMNWRSIEPTESQYSWDQTDAAVTWATANNLRVSAGPLVDFSSFGLPEWLWLWEGDLPSLSSFMCDYVETAVGRYHKRIRRWHLTAGTNNARVLKLGEDDLLWLTARLAEAACQADPDVELVVGIAQPWGEYMAREEHTYSPFVFADTLIRAGLRLSALDLEWVMSVSPRGSYCRDLLDASRVLDLYALLGTPLQVTLAYPSSDRADPLAESSLKVAGGSWLGEITADGQADWAADFLALDK
jgi:hypothetical protein